jgi:4-hydroxy-2-oxoheptanedioate aldolase
VPILAHGVAGIDTIDSVYPALGMTFRSRLESGEQLVGTFIQTPSPVIAEVLCAAGPDFVCVEGEHSGLGRETTQALVATIELTGLPAIVRVAANAPVEIAAALDAGASGVIVPRVDSADEAEAAAAAARFPPAGNRGVGPGRASGYGRTVGALLAHANAEVALGVQVESALAVERAAEIVSVDGVDFVFVGPGDLSLSMGAPGGGDEVEAAIASVLAIAREVGKPCGIWAPTVAVGARRLAAGFGMLLFASDLSLLSDAAAGALAELREVSLRGTGSGSPAAGRTGP